MPKPILPLILLLPAVSLLSCESRGAVPVAPDGRRPLLSLDNYGGFSHGGRRVVVSADNRFEETIYSDVPGDVTRQAGRCEADPEAGRLILFHPGGRAELLVLVRYRGREYWVSAEKASLVTLRDQEWLRQVSLRDRS